MFLQAVKKDLEMIAGSKIKNILFCIEFHTMLSYRIQHSLHKMPRPIRWLVMPIRLLTHYLTACQIHYDAQIEPGVRIVHATGIVIGGNIKIGTGTYIFQNVTLGSKKLGNDDAPVIGKNVTIYAGAVIVGNITIGNNAIIGANSVVTNNVPTKTIAAGNPAKLVKRVSK